MKSVTLRAFLAILLAVGAPAASPAFALAADCTKTSVGLTALPDLGGRAYQGASGGLYPDGANEPPAAYADAGARAAAAITPLDASGNPSPAGRVVVLSIGMSNTTMEFAAFQSLAATDAQRDAHITLVDGAQGGQDARAWVEPTAAAWRVVDDRLRAADATAAQVQAIWLKQAQASPRSDFAGYTTSLAAQMRTIVDNAAKRYPNLAQVFLSPRTYAGYATTNLNPEPYAYWSGFADKLLVSEAVAHPTATPWIGWGPYLWVDGTRSRADGFQWTCADVRSNDGTHPSDTGSAKVAQQLRSFFDTSPMTPWYRGASGLLTPSAGVAPTPPPAAPASQQPAVPLPIAVAGAARAVFAAAALGLRMIRRR